MFYRVAQLLLLLLLPVRIPAATPIPEQFLKNWLILSIPSQPLAGDPIAATLRPYPGLKVILDGHDYEWRSADSAPTMRPPAGPITGYAWTEIEAPAPTKALLAVNTTTPVTLRLNGELVPSRPADQMVPVQLHAGKNQLLLKTETTSASWRFACRFVTQQTLTDRFLAEALNSGEVDKVKPLLDTGMVDVNAVNEDGLSALHAARMHGHSELAAYLLTRGANPRIGGS